MEAEVINNFFANLMIHSRPGHFQFLPPKIMENIESVLALDSFQKFPI